MDIINHYYYFRLNGGKPYAIKISMVPINTSIMHNYQELTNEQLAFYLEHPTASIPEIVKCELNPPYVPPTPDIRNYIDRKIIDLENACYASVTITSLEYAAAADKVNNITADSYYTLVQAKQILADFRAQSKKALTVKNTYTPQIEAASTITEIDTIYEQAISQL